MPIDLSDLLADDETVMLADGFEDAFVGIGRRFGQPPFAVYDRDRCIDILVSRDSMCHEGAEEFFAFNVADAYVGEATPGFLHRKEGDA